ncbi:hypothetical protein F9K85_12495 [Brucella tritici]|uniref:Uncharacterized protein n=1 Tax=Brucella tritici TaxID=94626 RepID=A0A6L3YHL6_9HYPH|nr:hypothetical protein F9K91_08425 [Brucella tritici]KAB2676008.1 hypothetical protein F9K85_12495 [Brucella tritici]KAB2682363.1 hypothetical protein F9L08_17920 [Brucella tritici]
MVVSTNFGRSRTCHSERQKALAFRITRRKTASHFCGKCSKSGAEACLPKVGKTDGAVPTSHVPTGTVLVMRQPCSAPVQAWYSIIPFTPT